MKQEFFALSIVLTILIFPVALLGYQMWRSRAPGTQVVDLVAHLPEEGGFTPDRLRLVVGRPTRLRVTSSDVVHGLTIPGLGIDVETIEPGKVKEIDFTPTLPGRYAFACTRWCGADHWRMRGVIEVVIPGEGRGEFVQPTVEPPLYQQLGIDLDAVRREARVIPQARPSALRGATLGVTLPSYLSDPYTRRALVPAEAYVQLRAQPTMIGLNDDDIWNLVAWGWLREVKPEALSRAERLYARDCAACHGPEGRGDGPMGRALPGLKKMDPAMPAGPADFTDAARMLSASDAVLHGKILRGGMGTGMPEFGSLYTDEELWALVAYVRGFLFGR